MGIGRSESTEIDKTALKKTDYLKNTLNKSYL